MWLPLLDGTDRVGVLAVAIPDADDLHAEGQVLQRRLRRLAAVIAEIVVNKTRYGDTIVKLRRRVDMALAAEMQWSLLPP